MAVGCDRLMTSRVWCPGDPAPYRSRTSRPAKGEDGTYIGIAPVVIVITAARDFAGHAVCSQRPRNSSLRHGHEPREEAVAGLDVAGCRAPGNDPAAQSQLAAHTTGST